MRTTTLALTVVSLLSSSSAFAFVAPISSTSLISLVNKSTATFTSTQTNARRRRYDDENDEYYDVDEDGYYYDDEDDSANERKRKNNKNRSRNNRNNFSSDETNLDVASPFGTPKGIRLPESVSQALLAGVFVLGIGTGVTVDSQINTSPKDLASRDAIDQAAPNAKLCSSYGASAMAFDQRVFVSFNPFNVYVAQADVKPACVLRESNVVPVLQERGLINTSEVRSCKQNMNTWAFVGDLNEYPQLSCVYKSQDAQNEFLSNPKYGIGEDVWDDDRASIEAAKKSTSKKVKNDMTEGERAVFEKAAQLRKDADLALQNSIQM
mmetsp:Transcript_2453/g.3771  ORF Transcript_2453/g.3771 Transcript_2453/m.3771 type:complete len:323 (+) Transcript_2453:85-1053(+)